MPLTARHDELGTICGPLLRDEDWSVIYRPGSPLQCPDPDCEARMIAKVWKSSGLRFFAHHAETPHTGTTAPESWEHLMLKAATAVAIARIKGWRADVEQWGGQDDALYRADVLATSPRGDRVAFEVQHSHLHLADALERTRRMIADGIAYVIWLDSGGVFGATPLDVERISRRRRGPVRDDPAAVTPEGWLIWTRTGMQELGSFMAEKLDRLARVPRQERNEVQVTPWPEPADDPEPAAVLTERPRCTECGNEMYLILEGRTTCAQCLPEFFRIEDALT
jgi:hypothetical protein